MTTGQFWIYVVSVLLSPLLALQASLWFHRRRERRDRRFFVFQTLMRTRAVRLSQDHVQALNRIDLDFYGSDENAKAVTSAWKEYLECLDPANQTPPDRSDALFMNLLVAMGKCLQYDFDRTDIKRAAYLPIGHSEIETDLAKIRRGFADLLEYKKALPVIAVPPPPHSVPPSPPPGPMLPPPPEPRR